MKRHTPGPWVVGYGPEYDNIDAHEGDWGIVSLDEDGYHDWYIARVWSSVAEAEANARLIKSAPKLLEALEDLLEWCRHGDDAVGYSWAEKARAWHMVEKKAEEVKEPEKEEEPEKSETEDEAPKDEPDEAPGAGEEEKKA